MHQLHKEKASCVDFIVSVLFETPFFLFCFFFFKLKCYQTWNYIFETVWAAKQQSKIQSD